MARSRLYAREQGGTRRWYADLRDFADVGGRREALKPAGAKLATDDETVAHALLTVRLDELKRLRRGRAIIGEAPRGKGLADVAREHLILKADAAKHTGRWIATVQLHLERACAFLGASRPLETVTVEDVLRWSVQLEGQGFTGGTVRHHLNSLSNLYRRARSLGLVRSGYNPVADVMPGEKPSGRAEEARWLEVHEAAWLLDTARKTTPRRPALACPFLHPLVATFLLTGGRRAEVLGLEVDDVSFDRRTVTFRANRWRRLKTRGSARVVPLWPQLEAILRAHIFPADRTPRAGLLFPGEDRAGALAMVTNFDGALDHVASEAGWKPGEIRSRMFRHTYCAARLQSLEGGHPVSRETVRREMGHGSMAMVDRIYSHLGTVRHRSDVVEYRVEQHLDRVGELAERARSAKQVVTAETPRYRKSLSRP